MINNHFLNFQLEIKKSYEKIIEISKVLHDCTCHNLLSYECFLNHYKLIAIDLHKQNVDLTRQQINFVRKLEQNATIFFIIEILQETILEFLENSVDIS